MIKNKNSTQHSISKHDGIVILETGSPDFASILGDDGFFGRPESLILR